MCSLLHKVQMQAEFALFPEVLSAREESHLQAMTVYDLLTVALSRRHDYGPLTEASVNKSGY